MIGLKYTLHTIAWICRLLRNLCDHWLKVVLVLCILSPVSPHVRIPYALSYAECDYIGTRGIVSKSGGMSCNLVEIIDTRSHAIRWSL